MKKVIKGKMYNTKTAEKMLDFKPDNFLKDFYFKKSSLYMNNEGDFFVAGYTREGTIAFALRKNKRWIFIKTGNSK